MSWLDDTPDRPTQPDEIPMDICIDCGDEVEGDFIICLCEDCKISRRYRDMRIDELNEGLKGIAQAGAMFLHQAD